MTCSGTRNTREIEPITLSALDYVTPSCMFFVLLALKPPANGCNIVGYYMLRPFAHPATYFCILLGVVEQSLKTAKLQTQRLPTFLLFRDRRSVAQQCWICLHSSFQHCWGHVAKHANYTWSPIYPPHDALQVPKFGSCSICTPLHTRKEATTPCYVRLHITLVAFKSFSGRYSWSLQIRRRKVSREAKKWT